MHDLLLQVTFGKPEVLFSFDLAQISIDMILVKKFYASESLFIS